MQLLYKRRYSSIMANTNTKQITTKKLILTAMFNAIICVMSQIVIPLQPIPFSLSLLAIFLTGALLEPKYAFLATLSYILLGAFGLPVFAGLKGGIHILTGMTGGYIVAYPIMSFVTSISYQIANKIRSNSPLKNISLIGIPAIGMVFSLFICYLVGTLWFSHTSGSTIAYALSVCVVPFIAFDLIKIGIAIALGAILRRVTRYVITEG